MIKLEQNIRENGLESSLNIKLVHSSQCLQFVISSVFKFSIYKYLQVFNPEPIGHTIFHANFTTSQSSLSEVRGLPIEELHPANPKLNEQPSQGGYQ